MNRQPDDLGISRLQAAETLAMWLRRDRAFLRAFCLVLLILLGISIGAWVSAAENLAACRATMTIRVAP